VRRTVVKRPDCPPAALNQLSHDNDLDIRREVAKRPDCPSDTMLHLSGDLTVSWILCENPACIPQALRSIAVSTSTWANKIAAHRNCPSDLLEQYATAKSLTLRSIAALHPNCPQATLERLSHSRDKDILGSVARNPTCPPGNHPEVADAPQPAGSRRRRRQPQSASSSLGDVAARAAPAVTHTAGPPRAAC
jgi:hypothetical protein